MAVCLVTVAMVYFGREVGLGYRCGLFWQVTPIGCGLAWWARTPTRAGWRSVSTAGPGGLCVTTASATGPPPSSVGCWACPREYLSIPLPPSPSLLFLPAPECDDGLMNDRGFRHSSHNYLLTSFRSGKKNT